MKTNVTFDYNPETGMAFCHMERGNIKVCGHACCHPDDADFMSERTGCFIAEMRANIQFLRVTRDTNILPPLKTLRHLLSNMKTSKNYNPNSYETKMIRSQIHSLEKQLATINSDIAGEKQYLLEYIKNKDIMYRKRRGQK